MKNKIGILTFCNANNFGAILQAFAMQNYLKNNFMYDVEFINLRFNKNECDNQNVCKKKKIYIWEKLMEKYTNYKFKKFKKSYMIINKDVIYGDSDIRRHKLNYNLYIVGSDQVWNTDITNKTKSFFLDWVNNNKISYAASFGKSNINEIEEKLIKEELVKFNRISVREKEAKEHIEKSIKRNVSLVCDPVFLMSSREWINILKIKNYKNREKYIFVYYMEPSIELQEKINFIKKETGLKVKYLCGGINKIANVKHEKKQGPKEFLEKIYNAEFVVSNSFHAIAFSIIFEKKFIAVSHSKWNSRLENLLEISGSLNSIKDKNENFIIDGVVSNNNMKNIVESSKRFLDDTLKGI